MRVPHITIALVTSFLLLSACASRQPSAVLSKDCDVSWIDESLIAPAKACELRVLAKRCAISDQCYIRCEAKGGFPTVDGVPGIGGGCDHVCTGGGGSQTEEDVARNGGHYATQESVDCYNNSR